MDDKSNSTIGFIIRQIGRARSFRKVGASVGEAALARGALALERVDIRRRGAIIALSFPLSRE